MRRADLDKLSAMFSKRLPQWTPVRLTRGRLALARGEGAAREEIVIWSGLGGHCWVHGSKRSKENGAGWKDRLVEGVVAAVRLEDQQRVEQSRPKPHLCLAAALFRLQDAKAALDEARRNVPEYTGQHSPDSFYVEEQASYIAAAKTYADAVRAVCQ